MAQQYFEGPARVDGSQTVEYLVVEVDVGAQGHFEGEAVGEGDVLADGPKESRVLSGHHWFRGEPQVPELDEQGLQGLDLEYLGQRHASKRAVRLHLY